MHGYLVALNMSFFSRPQLKDVKGKNIFFPFKPESEQEQAENLDYMKALNC